MVEPGRVGAKSERARLEWETWEAVSLSEIQAESKRRGCTAIRHRQSKRTLGRVDNVGLEEEAEKNTKGQSVENVTLCSQYDRNTEV